MGTEDTEQVQEDLEAEDQSGQPDPQRQIKALERKLEEANRRAAVLEVKAEFPWLTDDHPVFKYGKPKGWRELAAAMKPPEADGQQAASEATTAPETTQTTPPEVQAAVAQFTTPIGVAAASEPILEAKEALAKLTSGAWTQVQFDANTQRLFEKRRQE